MVRTQSLPLVSIAIITYNQKIFLKECLDSIVNQDYQNIEIVVADDGSTDGTLEMLNEYVASSGRKFVVRSSSRNLGITKNSNQAHFACTGKYIAWMGGDDLMLQSKISTQVRYMEDNPECTICYHDLDVFDNTTGKTLYNFSNKVKPREGGLETYIKYGCFNGACSSMVRRSETPALGFNHLLPVASDWLYWVDSLSSGGKINYIDLVLGRYRRHDDNVTRKNDFMGQNSLDHMNSCNIILKNYPSYINEVYFSMGSILRSQRHVLPYLSTLKMTLRIKGWDWRSVLALFIYLCSFGLIKL